MRTFKFRVWDPFNNCFLEGQDHLNVAEISIGLDGQLIISSRDGFYELEQKRHTIQQFTGYLDKNNVEIYEGDIIKTSETDISIALGGEAEYQNGTIEWVNTSFDITQHYVGRSHLSDYIHCDCHPTALEIIGNVFETPELKSKLKEENKIKTCVN